MIFFFRVSPLPFSASFWSNLGAPHSASILVGVPFPLNMSPSRGLVPPPPHPPPPLFESRCLSPDPPPPPPPHHSSSEESPSIFMRSVFSTYVHLLGEACFPLQTFLSFIKDSVFFSHLLVVYFCFFFCCCQCVLFSPGTDLYYVKTS